jgi:glycosyltransferase involved in cell wall biosynthesis
LAETTNVVFCGTLGNKHHPELVLELAQSLAGRQNCRMVVAAEGVGAEWLAGEQERLQLPHLLLLPFQSIEDYPHVLATGDVHVTMLSQDASVYALPSRVMSQMCAGRAQLAVVPRDNYVGQVLAEAEAGVVIPPAEFAAARPAIEELLDNAALRERYAASGRRYAEERLSLDSVMPLYEQLLEHVAGRVTVRQNAASAERRHASPQA